MNDQDKLTRLKELFLKLTSNKVDLAEGDAPEAEVEVEVEAPVEETLADVTREEFDALVEIVSKLVEEVMPMAEEEAPAEEAVVEEEVVEAEAETEVVEAAEVEVETETPEAVVEETEVEVVEAFKHKPTPKTKKMGTMPTGAMSTQDRVNAMLFS